MEMDDKQWRIGSGRSGLGIRYMVGTLNRSFSVRPLFSYNFFSVSFQIPSNFLLRVLTIGNLQTTPLKINYVSFYVATRLNPSNDVVTERVSDDLRHVFAIFDA